MSAAIERVTDSGAWSAAAPALSVLIPFYGHDPRQLLRRLDAQAGRLGDAVEIVLVDDGTPDARIGAAVEAQVSGLSAPVRLVSVERNEGRARTRNRLVRHARGAHLLFLDSDMAPDAPDFLARWLEIARGGADVVFGGFTVDAAPVSRSTAVHRALARRSDCLPAEVRRRAPEKHVCTSNLLLRREVIEAEPFDESFTGWGWEDVEWAMRVSRRWRIEHVDNTATHLGLDTVQTLASKYEQSAANFARVHAAHPQMLATFPSFRAAKLLKQAPLRQAWLPALRAIAQCPAPVTLRAMALKLYRAGLYAEVV